MTDENAPRRPALGAGLVCFKGDQVLMIRRNKAPRLGEWSIPGGHVEWGETTAEAAIRETLEETGIVAEIQAMVELIEAVTPPSEEDADGRHMVLVDYVAVWLSGEPVAGDDAMHAEFVPLSALDDLGLWSETLRIIWKAAGMMGLAAPPASQ
ncbi:MAG: NUDIX hydrolase [Caulobacterales bacterium]